MMKPENELLNRLIAAAETASIRSPLGRWLTENHDAFAAMLKTYRPRWEGLAETFASEGLLVLPTEFWSDDLEVQAVARKRGARIAKRAWDRVHAKMKDKQGAKSPALSEAVLTSTPDAKPGPEMGITTPARHAEVEAKHISANPYGFKPGKLK